jgi:O-antigen/teichoic acid export membrane protein
VQSPPGQEEAIEAESTDPGGRGEKSRQPRFGMGSILKHAAIYGLGSLLSRVISLVMLPVYTRFLSPEDYGVMTLVEMTLDVLALLAGAQLVLGIFRFYHKADNEAERNAVVSTAFLTLTATYLVVGTLAFIGAGWLSQLVFGSDVHALLIRVAAANLVSQSLLLVPMSFARIKDLSTLVVGTGLVKLLLGLSLNILFVVGLRWGVLGIFLSSLITNTLLGAGMVWWLVGRVGTSFSGAHVRNLVRYGVPMIGMQVATFAATFGDRFFLQATGDTAEVGLYNMAYQFGFMLMVIGFSPFDQVWGPKRFEIARRADRDVVLSEGFLFMNLWLIWLAVACSLFIRDFFRIMTTPEFFEASRFVHLILLAFVFQGWASVQDIGILVRERTEYLTLANWLAAGVALSSFALLIPPYGGMGAAIATCISFGTRWILTYRFSQHLWRVRYRWAPVLRLLAYAAVGVAAGLAMPELSLLSSLLARSLLLAGFTGAIWYGGVLTRGQHARFRQMVGVLRARLQGRPMEAARE